MIMEIIDILTPRYNDASYFTVDTAAASGYVAVTAVGGPLGVWGSGGQMTLFTQRDNIRLLTAGFYIPESFTTADWYARTWSQVPSNSLQLTVNNREGKRVNYLPGYGSSSNGQFILPFPNYEHALDLYCNIANLTGSVNQIIDNQFYLTGAIYCNNISMVGIPSDLNGKRIAVIPFIKILHTLPIEVNPLIAVVESLTRSGSTATADFGEAGHSFVEGQYVRISGAAETAYNGIFLISNVTLTSIDYTVVGTPTTPATGTIIAEPSDAV
jgi:hypothetical protein